MHFVAVSNGLFEPSERWRKKEKTRNRIELEKKFTCICFLLKILAVLNSHISFATDPWRGSKRKKIYTRL